MRDLFRFWSRIDEPLGRADYLRNGLGLAALKYAIDAALIWFGAHVVWSPANYFTAGASWAQSPLSNAPAWLLAALGLTTLPFVSLGVTMSIRRAVDARIWPWLGMLFFVPLVNYVFMGVMCVLPSRPAPAKPATVDERAPNTLLAVVAGSLLCLSLVAVFVLVLKSYGAALFFGVPFLVGAVTAYVYNRGAEASLGDTVAVVAGAFILSAIGLLGVAIEGAVCILMSAPLVLAVAAVGASVGRQLARVRLGARGLTTMIVVLPLATPLARAGAPVEREVVSVVEIGASPDVVWNNVVSFSELPPPTEAIFRAGIAYPVRARIVGTGVGALRYCEFSTGPFVEPITRWEPGKRLSFGVRDHPPPMREWSPYRIAPPHLEGYFAARRGEFRLVALPNGRTRLEGSTWYTLDIEPTQYWSPLADALVHTIHQRVLRHIKAEAERSR